MKSEYFNASTCILIFFRNCVRKRAWMLGAVWICESPNPIAVGYVIGGQNLIIGFYRFVHLIQIDDPSMVIFISA